MERGIHANLKQRESKWQGGDTNRGNGNPLMKSSSEY
jgi:hypothetical protein